MREYRIFYVNRDRHITERPQIIECANDQEAIQKAQKFIDGRDFELWEQARLIARFPVAAEE